MMFFHSILKNNKKYTSAKVKFYILKMEGNWKWIWNYYWQYFGGYKRFNHFISWKVSSLVPIETNALFLNSTCNKLIHFVAIIVAFQSSDLQAIVVLNFNDTAKKNRKSKRNLQFIQNSKDLRKVIVINFSIYIY